MIAILKDPWPWGKRGANAWKGLAFWENRALTAHPSCIPWRCMLLSSPFFFSNCSLHREQRGELCSEQTKASEFKQTGRGYSWEPWERMHRRKMQLWRSPRSVWKHRENSEYRCCKMARTLFPPAHASTSLSGEEAQREREEWTARGKPAGANCSTFRVLFSFVIHQLGWGTALKVCWSPLGLRRWLFSCESFALALESSLYYFTQAEPRN